MYYNFDNWRVCVNCGISSRPKSEDHSGSKKYLTMKKKNFASSNEALFYEIQNLKTNGSFVESGDVLATRVVCVAGTLENCLVSLVQEGFEHN